TSSATAAPPSPVSSLANFPTPSRYRRSPSDTGHLPSSPPCSLSSVRAIRTLTRPGTAPATALRPSTMPSPPSTRPSDARESGSSAFAWAGWGRARRRKLTLNHPFFRRGPAQPPDRLQLFPPPTPKGGRVGIMFEETSLAYEPHRIDIMADESHDPAFLALNPNGKIPAIYDPDWPSGMPLALFESGAILLYLADKTGQFISADPNTRYETIQWVMWQMGGVGPTFGQVGFFNKFAGKAYEDKRPRDRYASESA